MCIKDDTLYYSSMKQQKQILGFIFIICTTFISVLAILAVLDVVSMQEFLMNSSNLMQVGGIIFAVSVVVGIVLRVVGSQK